MVILDFYSYPTPYVKTNNILSRFSQYTLEIVLKSNDRILTAVGTPSNCLAPWLEIQTPLNPLSLANIASSTVKTPFKIIGKFVRDFNHLTSSHVMLGSNNLLTYACKPDPPSVVSNLFLSSVKSKFANRKCGGNLNLFRTSVRRTPKIGASTVKTTALNPARSARDNKFFVIFRSL